jgi:hypothetical protein
VDIDSFSVVCEGGRDRYVGTNGDDWRIFVGNGMKVELLYVATFIKDGRLLNRNDDEDVDEKDEAEIVDDGIITGL